MAESGLPVVVAAIALSYVYAFVGGFTDAANSIATAVGTRVFRPAQAVLVAAIFETLGALTGTAVALTIGKGIVAPEFLSQGAVVAALLGATTWSLLTYRFGIPVSETHGLIGAILGVGLLVAGPPAINWLGLAPVLLAIVISPVLGALGGGLALSLTWNLAGSLRRDQATSVLRMLQRLSSIYMAFSHGRNDAQKPMGVLALALAVYFGSSAVEVPVWVIVSVGAVAGLGVAAGGWRIIRTLGMRVTGLTPDQGFAAEVAAATVLQVASQAGIPVSTTHTITAAIVGVGMLRGWRAIRWGLVRGIAVSWALTLPATILFGFVYAAAARLVTGG
ncbi:MAG: inorganic phosphate transporter [Chloroflexi bacterium GWC2_73_18]|nr:MAG: inorganic phosphate transporter [Chloroflexi bacterium GWC2_73_18]